MLHVNMMGHRSFRLEEEVPFLMWLDSSWLMSGELKFLVVKANGFSCAFGKPRKIRMVVRIGWSDWAWSSVSQAIIIGKIKFGSKSGLLSMNTMNSVIFNLTCSVNWVVKWVCWLAHSLHHLTHPHCSPCFLPVLTWWLCQVDLQH